MRKVKKTTPPADLGAEIARLVSRLQSTEQRLQELAGGELDSVLLRGGQSLLLQQAQEKLRLSEATQRDTATTQSSILNALPANIALLDGQGVILSVNDGWRNFTGQNALEGSGCGQGQNYLAICERAAGPCAAEAHAAAAGIRAVMSGAARQFSLEYPCHSPTTQSWFRLMVSPVNPLGPGGAVVMHLDITARKLAEHSLRENEERLRLITNLVPIGIFAKDAAGRHLFANPALAEIAGLSIPEIIGKTDFDLVSDPAQAETYRADDRTVMQSGRKLVIPEERRTDLSGRTRFLQTIKIPYTDSETGEPAVLGVCIDITERKQAEEKLRESEERFRGMFTATATGIAISTPHGRFLRANAAYCRMLGYTEEELRELNFATITHPDDLSLNLQLRDEMLAGVRDSFVMEKRYLKKDRGIVWTRHSVSALRVAAGEVNSFIVVAEDITDRKCMEETLRLRQTELQVLFDLMPAMVWFKDTQNGVLRINQRAAESMGKPVAEIEGKSMFNLYPQEAAKYYADDLEVIRTGVPKLEIVETLRDRNGKQLLIQTDKVPVFDKDGKVTGIVVMAQDITERLKSEEALRQSEKRFKALFEQAAVGVALVDAVTKRYSQVNQRLCEILGRSQAELTQLTAAEISHPETLGRDQELARQLTAGTLREFTVEKRYLRKDGAYVWVNVTISEMRAADGQPDFYIAVVQDITTRKKLEDSSRQAQKMEAMGTLAGGIAHDFNNILASINGYTELAQMTLVGNPEVRDHLGAVLQAGHRAAALVRQILAFSRQEQIERQPIELRPIVLESLKLLRATIPATIEFVTSLAADTPIVLADANQIHQILMNLGTNAWHAMKDRPGQIEIRLERCQVDAAHAASQPPLRPGLYVRLSVGDTGCGMDPATVRRIFEPFFTTKPQGEGTGLGLAVVHGIMESHDGVVTVHSQPGVGTIFHLYFPAATNETVEAEAAAGPVAAPGRGERILLVDDEELLVQLGRKTLATLGYEVEATTQPLVALEMVRAHPHRFALVITDQTMPKLTGLELAVQLRQIRPGLPILLQTGFSLSITPDRVQAAGICQVLLKPASIQTLGEAIRTALTTPLPP